MTKPNQKMTPQEALDYFDSLDVVPADMMIGKWRGDEPPPLKWSAPMIRKAEDQRWPLKDPSPKRLS